MATFEVFYRLELEGRVQVEANSPEAAEALVRDDTTIAELVEGVNLEGGRIENVEAQSPFEADDPEVDPADGTLVIR